MRQASAVLLIGASMLVLIDSLPAPSFVRWISRSLDVILARGELTVSDTAHLPTVPLVVHQCLASKPGSVGAAKHVLGADRWLSWCVC